MSATHEFVNLVQRPDLIVDTAKLINTFWKRPLTKRTEKLQRAVSEQRLVADWSTSTAPAHFILIRHATEQKIPDDEQEVTVVAHAQLKVAAKRRQVGRCCIAFSIVVHPDFRRRGLGSRILREVEQQARQSNFSFLYLYAAPSLAKNFYKKMGYNVCDPLAVKRKAFKNLKTKQLEHLEDLFSLTTRKNKFMANHTNAISNSHKTVDGYDAADFGSTFQVGKSLTNSVWLRKRLTKRYYCSITPVSTEMIMRIHQIAQQAIRKRSEISRLIKEQNISSGITRVETTRSTPVTNILKTNLRSDKERYLSWKGYLSPLIHFKQIGPSCGLCALAMATSTIVYRNLASETKETFLDALKQQDSSHLPLNNDTALDQNKKASNSKSHAPVTDVLTPPYLKVASRICTLLAQAQARGLTTDGEMFDQENMNWLCNSLIGIDSGSLTNSIDSSNEHTTSPGSSTLRDISSISAADLIETISEGSCFYVVPYDSQPGNCEPCFSKGRRSHYAIVIGAIWVSASCSNPMKKEMYQNSNASDSIHNYDSIEWNSTRNKSESREVPHDCVIVFQHSASKRPVVCLWSTLIQSNLQLHNAISTKSQWVIPAGGPNLKGRCLQVFR